MLNDVSLGSKFAREKVEGCGTLAFGAPDVESFGAVAVVLRYKDVGVACAVCCCECHLTVVENVVDSALEIILQHLATNLICASCERSKALKTVVIDEALLGEVLDGLAYHIICERLSLYGVHALLILELAITECDGELISHKIT